MPFFSVIQCVHPMVLVTFVGSIAVLSIKLEKKGAFCVMDKYLGRLVGLVSGITLEIYLIQYPIIGRLDFLPFPVNFVLVTVLILLSAWALHKCSVWIQSILKKLLHL